MHNLRLDPFHHSVKYYTSSTILYYISNDFNLSNQTGVRSAFQSKEFRRLTGRSARRPRGAVSKTHRSERSPSHGAACKTASAWAGCRFLPAVHRKAGLRWVCGGSKVSASALGTAWTCETSEKKEHQACARTHTHLYIYIYCFMLK